MWLQESSEGFAAGSGVGRRREQRGGGVGALGEQGARQLLLR
jgi:hypothetical protein